MLRSLLAMLVLFATGLPSAASTLLPGFTDTVLTSGALPPVTSMAETPDGRVLVATQNGEVRVVEGGALLDTAALTIAVDSRGERGLIGIAVDPDFEGNGFVYLHHTVKGVGTDPSFNEVTRFTMVGNSIDPTSALTLQQMDPLSAERNHNGGALGFGPDGQLYIATGENVNSLNAQNLSNKLGKLLRIDPATGAPSAGNPFLGVSGVAPEIWAYGFRNPFQGIAFSPDDGTLFINDVGERDWEEINVGVAGGNYGWPDEEGGGPDLSLLDPIFRYENPTDGCAITGGAFYGSGHQAFGSDFGGDYLFADYCNGQIRVRDSVTGDVTVFASGFAWLVDLATSEDGGLYYLGADGTLGLITGPFADVPEPSLLALLGATALALRSRRPRGT